MTKPTAADLLTEQIIDLGTHDGDLTVNGVVFNVVNTGDRFWVTMHDSNDTEILVGEWDYASVMPEVDAAHLLADDMIEYAA